MQDINNLDTLSFSTIDGELVQILNCHNRHWVCVSTVGCRAGVINVFDSMHTRDVPMKTKVSIASMMTTHCAHIYLPCISWCSTTKVRLGLWFVCNSICIHFVQWKKSLLNFVQWNQTSWTLSETFTANSRMHAHAHTHLAKLNAYNL